MWHFASMLASKWTPWNVSKKSRFWKWKTFEDHLLKVNISMTVKLTFTQIDNYIENRPIFMLLNCNCAKLANFEHSKTCSGEDIFFLDALYIHVSAHRAMVLFYAKYSERKRFFLYLLRQNAHLARQTRTLVVGLPSSPVIRRRYATAIRNYGTRRRWRHRSVTWSSCAPCLSTSSLLTCCET